MYSIIVLILSMLPTKSFTYGETSYRYIPDSTLRVTSVLLEPYLMINPDYTYNSGLPQYIGYIPDLLMEISRIVALDYVITQAPDNSFGYKTKDGSWNGMIGQIRRQEADIAAGPMYQTSARARVVDFTVPFINVEATVLLRKPPPGSTSRISSIEDLINQSEIQYGTLDRGVIIRAFKNVTSGPIRIMWRNMQRFSPSTFTKTNEDGILRVRREKYAFILPHTIGEYMAMQEPCDLIAVDRFLMKRGYSLAVGKGGVLLKQLNWALRTLSERGKLNDLYKLWWVDKTKCSVPETSRTHSSPRLAFGGTGAPSSECYTIRLLCIVFLSSWITKMS